MADPNQPIRVLIADQQSLFRQGIRSVLTKEENIEVCGEVDSGQEVLTVASVLLPDVILLDINLPPGGLDLTKAIKR